MTFIEVFTQLCNEIDKSPTSVCVEIGLSDAIYTYWKKNNSTPRPAMLKRIADYFHVTEDSLLGKTPITHNANNVITNSINESPNSTLTINQGLSKQEAELVALFREFGIEQQNMLLTFAFKLRDE